MLFSRYANPFLFINTLIKSNSLRKGLLDILMIKEEETMWDMYCSLLSNPLNKIKSFKEFKEKACGANVSDRTSTQSNLQEEEVKAISSKSNTILKNFKPQ